MDSMPPPLPYSRPVKCLSFKDRLALWLGVGVAGVLIVSALGYAGWVNLNQWLERYVAQQEAEQAAAEAEEAKVRAINEQRRKDWAAYWQTPEGKAEAARVAKRNRVKVVKPSAWDGSVPQVEALVRKVANDPGKVTFNEWRNFDQGEKHLTVVDFTVLNAFGGPVRHHWRVLLDAYTGEVCGLHDGETWVVDPTGK